VLWGLYADKKGNTKIFYINQVYTLSMHAFLYIHLRQGYDNPTVRIEIIQRTLRHKHIQIKLRCSHIQYDYLKNTIEKSLN